MAYPLYPLPCRVTAVYSWGGEQDDDLGFIEGDIIEVDSFGDGNWWHGKLKRNKMTGNFPSNFVRVLDEKPRKPKVEPLPASPPPEIAVQTPVASSSSRSSAVRSPVGRLDSTHVESPIMSLSNLPLPNSFSSPDVSYSALLLATEIEQQIQQLRQLQQRQLQNQRKNQIAHSLLTPQNLSSLVLQLNDYAAKRSNDLERPMQHSVSMREFSNSTTIKGDTHSISSDDIPPPPPPPAHKVVYRPEQRQLNSLELPNDDVLRNSQGSFVLPYDPDTLNQSRSSINEYRPLEGSTASHQFNLAESVTSSVLTALTDFSATSAGSYYRHKNMHVNNGAITSLPPLPSEIREREMRENLIQQRSLQVEQMVASRPMEQKVVSRPVPKEELDVEDTLKNSFMKSKYYRRVSTGDHFELEKSVGDVTMLNDGPDPKEVISAADNASSLGHNPLDVVFVEDRKPKKSTSKFLKKLFLKEATRGGLDEPTTARKASGNAASILNGNTPPMLKSVAFSDLSIDNADSEALWIENKVDLNRASTVSPKEYKARQKRVLQKEQWLILEPQRLVTDANSNEVVPISKYGPDETADFNKCFKNVDEYVRGLRHLPYISPKTFVTNEIAVKFTEPIDMVRACYIFCTEKVHLIELNEVIDIRANPMQHIGRVFQQKAATTYQLATLMKVFLDELGIKNELVLGYFKRPCDENAGLTTNHVWNSVLVGNEWRFLDCALGNAHGYFNSVLKSNVESKSSSGTSEYYSGSFISTEPAYVDRSVYFLTKPLELIHTHIPTLIEQQHVLPPLDLMIALSLPLCYPQFFKTGLRIKKFNNALTRLQDLEVFEFVLEAPTDIEIYCAVKPKDMQAQKKLLELKHLCLSQIFWKNNNRYCRIKATLPANCSKGFLEIYSGEKGLQKSLANIHPLSLLIPLYHTLTLEFKHGDSVPSGINAAAVLKLQAMNSKLTTYRELQFVTRYPTIHCQKHDLYVKEPQIKNLNPDCTYIFKMLQHPSTGLSPAAGFLKTKLALQSPTGRIVKLRKMDEGAHGLWEASVHCDEVGVWKGLVVTDGGVAWCVFAEWMCK